MPDTPNNREGLQPREPSKYLNWRSYGERLAKEAFWLPAIKGSEKDSDRAITPVVEAICVPAHCAPPGSPKAKHLCHLHAQLSLGQSYHRQKKNLASICTGSLWSYPTLCDPVDCGLPGFSVREAVGAGGRGDLQARILECTGQYWLPYPSRALYFLLP